MGKLPAVGLGEWSWLCVVCCTEVRLALCVGVFLTVLVCGRLWAWHISLVSVCQKPMFGSEGCMLKRENTPVVMLGSIYSFRNCGPGAVVWFLAAKCVYLHMGVYFVSLLLALARALLDSQLLALACDILVGLRLVAAHAF